MRLSKKLLGVLCAGAITLSAPLQAGAAPSVLDDTAVMSALEGITVNRLVLGGKVLVDEPTALLEIKDTLPRSYVVASIAASIRPEGGAMAGCAGTVDLKFSGCRVEATLSAERSNDGESWTTKKEKSFTATEVGVVGTDFGYYMTHGHYYRATMEAYSYDENGVFRDYMSVSSRRLYY